MSLRIAGLGALALVCSVAVTACSGGAAANDSPSTSDAIDNDPFRVPEEMTLCESSDDCVTVRMPTCCGNGGLVAVSKAKKADYIRYATPRSCSHDPYACYDAVRPPDRLLARCAVQDANGHGLCDTFDPLGI
jgi:hypothetical protein